MAKRNFGEKSEALYRAVRFEVRPSKEELSILLAVSEVLRMLFNSALAERQQVFTEFIASLYAELKSASVPEEISEIRKKLREAYKEHSISLFDQINALTARRVEDEAFASVTRNWQEETLDALDGAYKSFLSLRRKGDYDAHSPRSRDSGFFQKIPGRSGFKIGEGRIALSCGAGRKLSFPIPDYQQGRLAETTKLKKFELYRDQPNLAKSGRFWISVVYELPKPEATTCQSEQVAFVALGASSIGVVSQRGEEVIALWRSDKHWVPKIEAVEERMKRRVKGSRGWLRLLNSGKRRMHMISSRQHVQDEREIVDYLVRNHGSHFVVTELVVRSKEGKLADSSKPERGGSLGLNWAAQNTGSLSRLVRQLEEKVKEHGGSVRKHKLTLTEAPPARGAENKLWMARKLRESFLKEV
ncbi:MAG TPA: hypothetical protein VJC13_01095 [Candidatus Paceibacterota bacterium]|nr:CRISPR-associated protein Cas14e.1 [uncultured archaeon]